MLIASLPDLEAYNAEIEFLAAQKAAATASSSSGVPTDAARNTVKAEAVAKAKAAIDSAEGNESAFKDLLGDAKTVAIIVLAFYTTILLKSHPRFWRKPTMIPGLVFSMVLQSYYLIVLPY